MTKYEEMVTKITNIGNAFDSNWHEHYSCLPEIATLSYEERLKWKEFAGTIVADLHGNLHQDIEDIIDSTRDRVLVEIKGVIDTL